jgi:uncharacterized SAM-binding protein YcdF (DUF218 family)
MMSFVGTPLSAGRFRAPVLLTFGFCALFSILGGFGILFAGMFVLVGFVIWDRKDDNGHKVSNGIYFYRLEAGDFKSIKKIVLF